MMKWILAMIAVALPGPALAAPCYPPGEIQKTITGPQYNEQLAFIGLAAQGQKVILYTNAKTSTWTLVVESGTMACIIAAGAAGTKVEPDARVPSNGL